MYLFMYSLYSQLISTLKYYFLCIFPGCTNTFPNITKLRDHMRSHTQEKLLACPTCGGLYSNRTRFFDHCLRQVGQGRFKFPLSPSVFCYI